MTALFNNLKRRTRLVSGACIGALIASGCATSADPDPLESECLRLADENSWRRIKTPTDREIETSFYRVLDSDHVIWFGNDDSKLARCLACGPAPYHDARVFEWEGDVGGLNIRMSRCDHIGR
jgi:hypothetical protein